MRLTSMPSMEKSDEVLVDEVFEGDARLLEVEHRLSYFCPVWTSANVYAGGALVGFIVEQCMCADEEILANSCSGVESPA